MLEKKKFFDKIHLLMNNKQILKTPVKYGSSTYVMLCYLKMKNKPVSVDDFHKFSIGKIKPSGILRSFNTLVNFGLAKRCSNETVVITELGRNYLIKIAQKDHRSDN